MAALLRRHADVRETPDEIQVMSIKCLRAQCRTSGARSAEQPSQLCSAISVGDDLKIGYRDADVQLRLSPGPAGVMRGAATTEPEIAALLQSLLSARRENLGMFVRGLVQNGPLRAGLSVDEATDTVWTLTSAEVYHLLRVDRGWTREQYVQWLGATLILVLLP